MPELTQTVAAILAATGTLLIILGLRPLLRGWPRRYCPGPRSRWRRLLNPIAWWAAIGCGYDLRAARPHAFGSLQCPECGTVHDSPAALRRTTGRFRGARLGTS